MSRSKSTAIEVLAPAEQMAVTNTIQQATALAGLSPWQKAQIEWKVKRQRGELILQLAELESQTIYAEAVMTAQGRIDEAAERAALGTYRTQIECMIRAGLLRDDAHEQTRGLSEDSREIVAGAIDRLTGSYLFAMERRARSLS